MTAPPDPGETCDDGLSDRARAGIRAALASEPRVTRAILFGSRACGDARPASDIDLALEGPGLRLQHLAAILTRIEDLGLPVHVDLIIRDTIATPALEAVIAATGHVWYAAPGTSPNVTLPPQPRQSSQNSD